MSAPPQPQRFWCQKAAPVIGAARVRLAAERGFALLVALGAPAAAEEFSSAYRRIDLDKHCAFQTDGHGGAWRCAGYGGIPVRIGAEDERALVSFGPRAFAEKAGRETLAPFNRFEGGVVEWRLDGTRKAFAVIARWKALRPSDRPFKPYTGSILVVTRLGPGGVCHVGYVDARVNADANALARTLADGRARTFRCGEDRAVVVGKREPGFDFVSP